MPQTEIRQDTGTRHLVNLPVRAEWDEERTGTHVIAEGVTENVGPAGAVVHLPQLPAVGSRINISVQVANGSQLQATGEVLRLVRDPQMPLASLNIVSACEKWRGMIWEQAKTNTSQPAADDGEDRD